MILNFTIIFPGFFLKNHKMLVVQHKCFQCGFYAFASSLLSKTAHSN